MTQPHNAQRATVTALFELGTIVGTPGAIAALAETGTSATALLDRHIAGDWGELDSHDMEANDLALFSGDRILSAYPLPDGERVWIITEADRSTTTLLLPEEY